jgi:hypothetical protein
MASPSCRHLVALLLFFGFRDVALGPAFILRPGNVQNSVLVVVTVVGRVPVSIVDIVDVIGVWHRDMAATVGVRVIVAVVCDVVGRLAFIGVAVVFAVQMAVMHVVDVFVVRDRDVTAALTVDVGVFGVHGVHRISQIGAEQAGR